MQNEVTNVFSQQLDATRSKVLRLIDEQIGEIFLPLLSASDLLKSKNANDKRRNLSSGAIDQWEQILHSERYKVDRLEASFVVIGTMKAGKSTTINTIVGAEVLPNRNHPMTTLPTVIRHCPGKKEPELFFPDPKPMNRLISQLQDALRETESEGLLDQLPFCATDDGKELVRKITDGSLEEVHEYYKGQKAIFDFLKNINDIWRLCISEGVGVDIDHCLSQYDDIQKFPAIEIEFAHLNGQEYGIKNGKFALVDTPGTNEAGQTFLKKIVREQLDKASAVLAVLDYTQLNAEAEADVRRSLNAAASVKGDRLFVLVNKFDQKDRHGMDVETLRSYVAKQLFEGRLPESHVYPVSSRYGYLASKALQELEMNSRLPDYTVNPWVEDFIALALGASWEYEDIDLAEIKNRAQRLWRNSRFDAPLAEVVKVSYANCAAMSLQAAVDKMMEYNKRIIESLQLRQNALNTDAVTIEESIKSLNDKIMVIEDSKDEARRLIDESTKILQEEIFELFGKIDRIVKDEIERVFDRENWITRRLMPFVGNIGPEKSEQVNPFMRNDFHSQAEANQFIDKLIAAGAETIEPQLQEMHEMIEMAVDELVKGVWNGVNSRLDKALKAAERKLSETFSVETDFPKPSVKAIQVDFNSLYQSSIKEDNVVRTNVAYERKWYTLWSRRHKVVYQHREHIYCVYTKDVVEQLQEKVKKDLDTLWITLDNYMRSEFKPAISTYFIETADYLKRISGDLSDAIHDKTLQSEQLENLLFTINSILGRASGHQENLQLMEEIISSIRINSPLHEMNEI